VIYYHIPDLDITVKYKLDYKIERSRIEKYKNGRNNRLASWNRRIGIGGAFVGVGWTKNNQITTYLKAEQVTLGLFCC